MEDLTNNTGNGAPPTNDDDDVEDGDDGEEDDFEDVDENQNFHHHCESCMDSPAPSAATPGAGSTPGPGSCTSTPGLSSLLDIVVLPAAAPSFSDQHREDFRKVREAFQAAGGSTYKTPPDLDKLKARRGQSLEVVNEDLDIGLLAETPDRPDKQSLESL